MDIEDVKNEKARLTDCICNLVTSFEEKTGVTVTDIQVFRKDVNIQGRIDTWQTKTLISVNCLI